MKVIIINGPNLEKIKLRNQEFYGDLNFDDIRSKIHEEYPLVQFDFIQSNSENEIIEIVHRVTNDYDALIINPGGLSHTSVALRDALEMCNLPKIEVHLSNISSRDHFRKTSLTATVCNGYISGFKHLGYLSAIYILQKMLSK
ncbi:MAG: 3-dehydroquinate dehydratase [Ignavibacteriales bacterium]|nr:3-dehydroquinate dehydratase [Ignavibacteriales bacterium]